MAGGYSPDEVARYCSFFESKLSAVRALEEELFQRPLLLSMLESIGKCRYSPILTGDVKLRNGLRFKKLVNEHGNWPEVGKHSLPQILYRLEEQGVVTGDLYAWVSSVVAGWRTGEPQFLSADGETTTLMAVVTSGKEKAAVDSARHDSLLWIYRNSVVHEFREPGYPWPFPETHTPHYIHMTDVAGAQLGRRPETWELSYPVFWLEGLVRSVLAGLASHCNAHGLNPYDAYQFGSLWSGT
jgi:hypothetical protein